jgi:hypothetical protein
MDFNSTLDASYQDLKKQKKANHLVTSSDSVTILMIFINHSQVGISVYHSSFFRMVPFVCKSLFCLMRPLFPLYKRIYDFSAVFIQYHTYYRESVLECANYLPTGVNIGWRLFDGIIPSPFGSDIYTFLRRDDPVVGILSDRYFYSLKPSVDLN